MGRLIVLGIPLNTPILHQLYLAEEIIPGQRLVLPRDREPLEPLKATAGTQENRIPFFPNPVSYVSAYLNSNIFDLERKDILKIILVFFNHQLNLGVKETMALNIQGMKPFLKGI